MNILTEPYPLSLRQLPQQGKHIIAHQTADEIVVYQAYNPAIASYATANQVLGGASFSYNRMSWIKPNFLWMMFRSGWAQKENQERILALWLLKSDFDDILSQAVRTTYDPKYHSSAEAWADSMKQQDVRMQWDPDHDPYGNKVIRRAVQLGLRGDVLKQFGQEKVRKIEDITAYVQEQFRFVESKQTDLLQVPLERVYTPHSEALRTQCEIDVYTS